MKKYLKTIIISIIIGFFLSVFVIKQYDKYTGIRVYNEGFEYYFLLYGEYDNKEAMEKDSIRLANYIYRKEKNKYYMYVGITTSLENANKIKNYYKNEDKDLEIRTYFINNKKFYETIKNLDNILSSSSDETVIKEIVNQGLNNYEEVILNGDKN